MNMDSREGGRDGSRASARSQTDIIEAKSRNVKVLLPWSVDSLRLAGAITLIFFVGAISLADEPVATAPAEKIPAAGTSPWSKKKFLHPPLKCMEPYTRIDEYPVLAWAFHGRGSPGYNEEFVKQAEMSGFNVLIDAAVMLKPCEASQNMKLMAVVFRFPPERIKAEVFDKFGDHPRLLGLLLDDNCPRIYPWSITASNWMRDNYPHLAPWISENPSPAAQSRTAIRILGTQNYHVMRVPGPWGRQAYCSTLGRDRDNGNAMNMTFWPLLSSPGAPGAVRFEAFAAAAHGAQGVCYFAYCPGDLWPQWKAPQGSVAQAAAEANNYLRHVAGWHIWGTRCQGVLHGPRDGDVPQNAGRAAPGEIIETMDDNLLAGLLLPEKEFLATVPPGQKKLPMYAFVVDKRYEGPRRTVHVAFGSEVSSVEVFAALDKDKGGSKGPRIIEPGWSVPLELNAGSGLLVRLNPEKVGESFQAGQETYTALVESLRDIRVKMGQRDASWDKFNGTLTDARRTVASLRKQADDAREKVDARQERDILDRLERGIAKLRVTALQPHWSTPGEPFAGSVSVQVQSQIKGADIRVTTDGSEPTLKSPQYAGPLRLERTTTLRARAAAADPTELIGEEITAQFTLAKSDLLQPHRIVFQSRGGDVAQLPVWDSGDAYGIRDNGFAYGWDRDRTKATVAWTSQGNGAPGGGLKLSSGAQWTHLVPSGRYEVTLSLGDPTRPTRDAIILVEGVEFFAKAALTAGEFKTITHEVEVRDGKLTLEAKAPKPPRRGKVQFTATVNFIELRGK